MNQALYGKMKTILRSAELARLLVEAGLDKPRAVREASDRQVGAIVGAENLAAVRARIPAAQ